MLFFRSRILDALDAQVGGVHRDQSTSGYAHTHPASAGTSTPYGSTCDQLPHELRELAQDFPSSLVFDVAEMFGPSPPGIMVEHSNNRAVMVDSVERQMSSDQMPGLKARRTRRKERGEHPQRFNTAQTESLNDCWAKVREWPFLSDQETLQLVHETRLTLPQVLRAHKDARRPLSFELIRACL